jgi:Holliday junction resolvasome RuvABC endonuclease subunit
MNILGLDASTSCVGYALLSDKDEILKADYVKFHKDDDYEARLLKLSEEIYYITSITDYIYCEDYMKGFASGYSSANTITKLATFSGMIRAYFYLKHGMTIQYVHVATARKLNGIKNKKPSEFKDMKEYCFDELQKRFGEALPVWYNQRGKNKGKIHKNTYDVSDAIVIARAGLYEKLPKALRI